jgi:hypothetical protein
MVERSGCPLFPLYRCPFLPIFFFLIALLWLVQGLFRHAILPAGPPTQVRHLASLAAERPPGGIHRPPPAEHAERRSDLRRHLQEL